MTIDEKYQERVLKLGEICALRSKLISVGDPSYTDAQALDEIKPIVSEAIRSRKKLGRLEKLSEELEKRTFKFETEKREIYSSGEAHEILIQINNLKREYELSTNQ